MVPAPSEQCDYLPRPAVGSRYKLWLRTWAGVTIGVSDSSDKKKPLHHLQTKEVNVLCFNIKWYYAYVSNVFLVFVQACPNELQRAVGRTSAGLHCDTLIMGTGLLCLKNTRVFPCSLISMDSCETTVCTEQGGNSAKETHACAA